MPTIRRLFKSGNSVVVSIPEHLLQALRLKPRDHIWLSLVAGPSGQPRVLILNPSEEGAATPGK